MRRARRLVPILAATSLVAVFSASARAAERDGLVWHVEGPGSSTASSSADRPINPASVVKVATTLWALAELGGNHRFTTAFGRSGDDLCVVGGGDPDFHVENAWLVARALNRQGIHSVSGRVLVDGRFWIGWEGGAEGRTDGAERKRAMAGRLRDAMDPRRRDPATRRALAEMADRREIRHSAPAGIEIEGGVGLLQDPSACRIVSVHRSNPLTLTLARLNAWSNNDMDRLADTLGPPAELVRFLGSRRDDLAKGIELSSLSGLGRNRMTPRQIVALLGETSRQAEAEGILLEEVVPAAGCGPGTLKSYPEIATRHRGAVTAKTGTLTRTDGGVSVLAGRVRTAEGGLYFCVAAPESGTALSLARAAAQDWLLETIASAGGAPPRACSKPVVYSDTEAEVVGPGG